MRGGIGASPPVAGAGGPASPGAPRYGDAGTVDRRRAVTRFLVVLTDVRPLSGDGRNERDTPERRRQVVGATSREAAEKIAGAFMALGMVRAGRQRVKVIAVGRKRSVPQ
jgi:hypothetical protein